MIYILSVFILIINSRYWYILSVNILKFNNRYWYIVSVTSKCNTTSCYRYLSKLSTLPRSLTGYNHTFNINTHTLGTSHKLRHQKGEGGGGGGVGKDKWQCQTTNLESIKNYPLRYKCPRIQIFLAKEPFIAISSRWGVF